MGPEGLTGLRNWFYVIGLVGFGLTTMMPVFWVIWKWGPEVGREAATREVSWLTPPLDENVREMKKEMKEEVKKDALAAVGR